MAKEKFERLRYLGPVSTLALGAVVEGKFKTHAGDKTVPLITGQVYPGETGKRKLPALPDDHPIVQSLIARKLLVAETALSESGPTKTKSQPAQ